MRSFYSDLGIGHEFIIFGSQFSDTLLKSKDLEYEREAWAHINARIGDKMLQYIILTSKYLYRRGRAVGRAVSTWHAGDPKVASVFVVAHVARGLPVFALGVNLQAGFIFIAGTFNRSVSEIGGSRRLLNCNL